MKLKDISELMEMFDKMVETKDCAEVVNYIDLLHGKIKNYQNLIDSVSEHNEHIEF